MSKIRKFGLAILLMLGVFSAQATDKTLFVGTAFFPSSLQIGRIDYSALSLITQTNEPLVLRDDSGNLMPGLAVSWQKINNLTWQFKLRQNVTWHDGKPFTAKDVAFTIARVLDPKSAYTSITRIAQISNVKIIDDHTVEIQTKTPFPTLIRGLSDIPIEPAHYHAAEGAEAMTKHPIGTGPFVFEKWVPGNRYELRANLKYWGGAPKFDKLVIRQLPEASTRVASFIANEIQIAQEVPIDMLDQVTADKANKIEETTTLAGLILSLDTRKPPFDNPKVREALDYAIDKPTILSKILKGHSELLQGQLLTSAALGFNPNIKPRPFNQEKAKALLKEAGFNFDTPIPITFAPGRYLSDVDIVNAVIGMLNDIGIKASANQMESGALYKAAGINQLGPVYLVNWYNMGDAAFATPWFTQASGRATWYSKEYEDLYKAAQTEMVENKRRANYQRMMEIMHQENPAVFLFGVKTVLGVKNTIRGFHAPADTLLRLSKVEF